MQPTILTIAGSDSSGGAGIQADLKSIAANGGYGATVVTAITAQNTCGVSLAEPVAPAVVRAQLEAVLSDLDVAAVKSGMLANVEVIEAVADELERAGARPFVCDPVMISKSGFPLLPAAAVDALAARLVPLASVVTPNVHEAEALSGVSARTVEQAEDAARKILARGATAVLVKGGHLSEDPATDVLVTRDGVRVFHGEWIRSRHTHGTGCTYSAAIATNLGRGEALEDAVSRAKAFIAGAIRGGLAVGRGIGPTDPFHALRRADGRLGTGGDGDRAAAGRRVGRLHVITDEVVQTRHSHAEIARLAAEGGADVVQFREKRARSTRELERAAAEIARAIEGTGATLVVNDRADVAVAAGAGGVHVGREDLEPEDVRRMLPADAVVGMTANSLAEAVAACARPVDYLGVGPVFETASKANPAAALGPEGLRRIVRAVDKPVVAIGGITLDRLEAVVGTGVHGVAVLSAVAGADDPREAARRFRRALDTTRGAGDGA